MKETIFANAALIEVTKSHGFICTLAYIMTYHYSILFSITMRDLW